MIVARDVTRSLGGEPVLRGLSLVVPRGAFVAIVGPSGCGKSTLLALLAALDRPDGGSLVVDGVDIAGLGESARAMYRRTKVGLVLQFWNLLPTLTALENVETALEIGGLAAAVRTRRARDYLDRVGLADATGKFPGQLSGGMQQRVAIARALAREPQLLLADEPTGSLDRENGAQVFEMIASLQRSMDVTCVMVTHDVELAARTGHTITLGDGRVVDERIRASPGSPR